MGVSFKVSKIGTRYRPKPSLLSEDPVDDDLQEDSKENSRAQKLQGHNIENGHVAGMSSEGLTIPEDHEISFTLNLYPDGYSIGKPSQNGPSYQSNLQDIAKLCPYDRSSEPLFSAIEAGRLPGDILDDIPCKFVNGVLICEVLDYRKIVFEQGSNVPAVDASPIVNKVRLKMSLENVVKDIPSISDNSWTYGDLMEVESQILKALQPQLCLDPTPKLDRLCADPVPNKLDLGLSSMRRKRLREISEVTVTSNNKIHGKKISIDRIPESNGRLGEAGITSGNLMLHVQDNLTSQNLGPSSMLALRPKSFVQDPSFPSLPMASQSPRYQMGSVNQGSGSFVNASGVSSAGQDMTTPYADNVNQDPSNFNKRSRLIPQMGADGIQQQQIGHMDGLHGSDMNWKSQLLHQQAMARSIQHPNTNLQKHPSQVFDGVLNQDIGGMSFAAGQQGMRYGAKEEQLDADKLDGSELYRSRNMRAVETDANLLDAQQSRLQPRFAHHAFMRPGFPQSPWNNSNQDSRKEDQLKRKSVQSPRLSAGALPQSPLSSKSGEFSSGSAGPHYGAVGTTNALGVSQKDKAAVNSIPAVGGTPSLTSNANDSMQRQHQAQLLAKRRSNSIPKTSGVGSPSGSNMSLPLNANSPSVGTPPLVDQAILERFSKVEAVTMRYQLNARKNKTDDLSIKNSKHSVQPLSHIFSTISNNEDFKDDAWPLSKSLVGGSMNNCKTRIIKFVQADRVLQGNSYTLVPRFQTGMLMSMKPTDGTVALHYGDIDEDEILGVEDYLSTLPNTHQADLLAAQFCSLMVHDGYHLVEDKIQLKPTRMQVDSTNQNNAGLLHNNSATEMQQYADAGPGQASTEAARPTNSGNASLSSPQNVMGNMRMLPPGNSQAVQMSQGLMSGVSMPSRPQQQDLQQLIQPQMQQQQQQQPQQMQNQHSLLQQQQSQYQRSTLMLGSNNMSHLNALGQNSNMQLGNQMVNKQSPLQLQMLQQQQQQQQQQQLQQPQQAAAAQMPRKMMMGVGTAVGMNNMGNSASRIGVLGNAMGIGGARGIGGLGTSAPMGTISGMGNMGQNQVALGPATHINAISQQFRSGTLTPAQATMIAKLRAAQNRSMLGGPQAGLNAMSGARQMHPGSAGLSMLGQNLGQSNLNPMQRSTMGNMAPPKSMVGMNLYMNPQQQQQQMQFQQQQQQLQNPQQHQQLQQMQQHQLQQQQQQQQQHQMQQQQQHQMQQQQQDTASPLQALVPPSQVGSPSTMGIQQMNQQQQIQQQQQTQQQQPSPQQMSQRTPMSPQQMSSSAMHALSAGNPEAGPGSPQLSSQTLGSVGSITNSPMELGVNKSNSVSNN